MVSAFLTTSTKTVVDPDLELRGGGARVGAVCFAGPASFSSFCDFLFFFWQNKGGPGPRAPPLHPPLLRMSQLLQCSDDREAGEMR